MDNQNNFSGGNIPGGASSGGEEKSGAGALIGSIIVIIVLVVGAFYFWGKTVNDKKTGENPISDEMLTTTSDSVSGIEENLNATNFSDIDADFNASLDEEVE